MASEAPSALRFFVLDDDRRGPSDSEFTLLDDNVGEAPRCRQCGDIIGMLPSLPPYRVTLEVYGETLGDFIEGFGCTALVTKRFLDAFLANNLRGIPEAHPVEVTRVRRQRRGPKPPVSSYVYIQPPFGGAAVDEARSRIRRNEPISCDWCRSTGVDAIRGFALEPDSWNGDDILIARGLPGNLVVSERFARFVAQHGFTNMRLTPTEEYTWDPLGKLQP